MYWQSAIRNRDMAIRADLKAIGLDTVECISDSMIIIQILKEIGGGICELCSSRLSYAVAPAKVNLRDVAGKVLDMPILPLQSGPAYQLAAIPNKRKRPPVRMLRFSIVKRCRNLHRMTVPQTGV